MATIISDGVWPVMLTPFTEDNRIDYGGVEQLLNWYRDQGVAGVFAVCQSSEMFFLSRKERLDLARFICAEAPDGMDIIASGHVADSVNEQVEDAKRIIDFGVKAYVFISNRFADENAGESEVKRSIERLISRVDSDSFGIYECPHPYKRLLSPELLKWCADTGRFTFLKDTCCDLGQLRDKARAVEGTDLKIFNANAATLLESLKLGISGYSGVMANFHAAAYVWLCANYDRDPGTAGQIQDLLGLASVIECQEYPVNAKYHLQLDGLDITLGSRVTDPADLTGSRRMEVEQLRRTVRLCTENLVNKAGKA